MLESLFNKVAGLRLFKRTSANGCFCLMTVSRREYLMKSASIICCLSKLIWVNNSRRKCLLLNAFYLKVSVIRSNKLFLSEDLKLYIIRNNCSWLKMKYLQMNAFHLYWLSRVSQTIDKSRQFMHAKIYAREIVLKVDLIKE